MIILDHSDKRPIYEQIVEKFQTLILNGVLEPESKMPSVRNLAVQLSINPNTIQKAYAELERQGFIYSKVGRGNFVKNTLDFVQKERERVLRDLKTQIHRCQKLGISLKEIQQITATLYEEE